MAWTCVNALVGFRLKAENLFNPFSHNLRKKKKMSTDVISTNEFDLRARKIFKIYSIFLHHFSIGLKMNIMEGIS